MGKLSNNSCLMVLSISEIPEQQNMHINKTLKDIFYTRKWLHQ